MKKQAPKHTTATEVRSAMAETGRKPTPLQAQVLLAARRRCDDMGDSQAARDQMRREVLDTPPELLAAVFAAERERLAEATRPRRKRRQPVAPAADPHQAQLQLVA